MQLTVLISNIFDRVEVAGKIAQLEKLLHLGGFSIEKAATEVLQTVRVDVSQVAEGLTDAAQAAQIFGAQEVRQEVAAPLPPAAPALSPAVAEPSTNAPAAAPASTPSPSPAAPPAPLQPVAAATPAPAFSGETDKNGYAWDERIHAGTRAKNGDGTWRYKRGVHDDLVEQVEAAQRASRGAAPPPSQTVSTEPVPAAGAPVAAPPPPVTAAAPVVPTPPQLDEKNWTFMQLTRMTQNALTTSAWTQDDFKGALTTLGLADFQSIVGRPDLFRTYVAMLPESVVLPMLGG